MTDRYRVLALDQRGHGETAWAPADRYGTDEMAEDLIAFVAALGLQDFTLLGLSMGGMVAMNYAGRRPKELGALVIVDIGPEIVAAGASRIQTGVRASDVFASRDEAFAAARAANPRPPEAHHRHRVDYQPDAHRRRALDLSLRPRAALAEHGPRRAIPRPPGAPAPTSTSRRCSSAARSATSSRPRSRRACWRRSPALSSPWSRNSGHSVPLDAPDAFLAAARGFLKG